MSLPTKLASCRHSSNKCFNGLKEDSFSHSALQIKLKSYDTYFTQPRLHKVTAATGHKRQAQKTGERMSVPLAELEGLN